MDGIFISQVLKWKVCLWGSGGMEIDWKVTTGMAGTMLFKLFCFFSLNFEIQITFGQVLLSDLWRGTEAEKWRMEILTCHRSQGKKD